MNIGRTIVVVLVALSVALLPVAGGSVLALSLEKSLQTNMLDCCPHGKPCEKKPGNGCGSMAGCALTCFDFSGTMVSGIVARPVPAADIEPVLISLSVHLNPTAPPLPPPRV